MLVYLYDNTFEGLLTAIYEAYYSKPHPDSIYSASKYSHNLLDEVKTIETDTIKFDKVYNAIINKISKNALNKVYLAYLSETLDSPTYIYKYLIMGFKVGSEVDLYKNHDTVINIDTLVKKVSLERHRMYGFVRFKNINDILISKINPDHNVLPLLGNHFSKRLGNENFVIYDEGRNLALIYNKDSYCLSDIDQRLKDLIVHHEDSTYEELWQEYFKSVNVEERKNSRLQSRMMPKRYWKNLTETQEEL